MIGGLITTITTWIILLLMASSFGGQEVVSAFCISSQPHHYVSIPNTSKFTSAAAATSDDDFFDPFLHSPHDYPDGVDNGSADKIISSGVATDGVGAVDEIFESSASSFGFASQPSSSSSVESVDSSANNNNGDAFAFDLFDPLLSPHAYPDGTDAGSAAMVSQEQQQPQTKKKLGILLIDHGSKRKASNEHLQFIAETYEASIIQRDAIEGGTPVASPTSGRETVVRAAHMEIVEPSILTSLRNMITNDKVTEIVCVPYFLSPGKHSTVDVPNLIAEARKLLDEEGLLQDDDSGSINIVTSQALGTQLEYMLGGVNELVDFALKKNVGD